MLVLLSEPAAFEVWLIVPARDVLALRRPLPAERLHIVAIGLHCDGVDLVA